MRKVIGIGETVLDIIFRNGQPTAAVPGGSVFNAVVSLARAGIHALFIGETGDDRVGSLTRQFMADNGIPTDYMDLVPDSKSPISLAFLNEKNEAQYSFYHDRPVLRPDVDMPAVTAEDIILVGSYYALNPLTRDKVVELLERARRAGAIVYYDPNFRASHKDEAIKLGPTIIENLEYADIVRGAVDDFRYMYGIDDAEKIYRGKIKFYCPNFLLTAGAEGVKLRTARLQQDFEVPHMTTVSTIGAGDNFNAGVLFGLVKHRVRLQDLDDLDPDTWTDIVAMGMRFAANVCGSVDNYISRAFAAEITR